jgi:HAD superfamily hydrolase (TIGR01509 family)
MKAPGIDVVLFDLGGVLVELAGIGQMMAWCPQMTDVGSLWRQWLGSQAVRRFETGGATRHAFAADMVAEFGLPVDPDVFLAAFSAWPKGVVDGSRELLTELRAHCTIASVSNTNEIHWARVRDEWALHGLFHHNFPSHLVGALKPDDAYFEHVLDALGSPAARVLFVDDNAINVEAAARLGIVARRATSPAEVRRVLVDTGFDPRFAQPEPAT